MATHDMHHKCGGADVRQHIRMVPPLLVSIAMVLAGNGCRELTGTQALPAGVHNPSYYQTQAGALGMRNAALIQLEQVALPAYVTATGLLTDELQSNQAGASFGLLLNASLPVGGSIDERILPALQGNVNGLGNGSGAIGPTDGVYNAVQGVRGTLMQASAALATYDTASDSHLLQGELYALQGYTEILLADFFCSGVPLSTLDFQQDFTYHASSTTVQVYQAALAKLDTATLLAAGSAQIQNLAAVLKGRALLDLGRYAQAAQAVATVSDAFQYQLAVPWTNLKVYSTTSTVNTILNVGTVADREGGNGLPFILSHDPRTTVRSVNSQVTVNGVSVSKPLYFPYRYQLTGFSPFPVADGIEAGLIRAEAALQANDTTTWLATLNALRVTGLTPADSVALVDTVGVTTPPYSPLGRLVGEVVDTVWNANHTSITHVYTIDTYRHPVWTPGTAGVSGLYPIADPGTAAARVDTMFAERAAWLFMTGHRQGDLRRLIRQYGRPQDDVYPVGVYTAPGTGQYGNDVTAPIAPNEDMNPLFHGCLDRDA